MKNPQKALITGQFKGHRDGYGFVIPEIPEEDDVYIPKLRVDDAMHGDRVVAKIEKVKGPGRREGRILRILERAHTHFVGRFEKGRKRSFVVPADKRLSRDLLVRPDNVSFAQDGDIVQAKILTYPHKGHHPEGVVTRVIGKLDDPKTDTQMVIASYGFAEAFPPEVVVASEQVPDQMPVQVRTEIRKGRVDLRALTTVTIDGERARDFDDAVSIEKREDGFRLWVHIADVAHYVPENGALDREAFLRGTSVYFPDAVIPMFPERLSNGICSLKPKEDRLTLTVQMDFDPQGKPLRHEIYESVIQSDARMTYTEVRKICEEDDLEPVERHPFTADFQSMKTLAAVLYKQRRDRGSLDFDLPVPEIILSLTGETVDIIREERNVAHRLIEEFMLLANETVAQEMTRRGMPFLYRIHEPPPRDRMAALNDLIVQCGLGKLRMGEKVSPKELSRVLEEVKGHPEEKLLHQALLRSMQRAIYSSENKGHFGLASAEYTHFTSPIRRYPDLVVHRLLKRVLQSQIPENEKKGWAGKLPSVARHSSAREQLAVEAEREAIQRKKIGFMVDKVGKKYNALITGVSSFGFFVMLEDYFVEGLVHVSSLRGDFYNYEEAAHALIGRRRRRVYRLGQQVCVVVTQVDVETQKIDFRISEESRKRRGKLRKRVESNLSE